MTPTKKPIKHIVEDSVLPAIGELSTQIQLVQKDLSYLKERGDEGAKITEEIVLILKGNGGQGKSGIIGRVEHIENWIDNRSWTERAIIGAAIVQVIVMIFLAIQNLNKLSSLVN